MWISSCLSTFFYLKKKFTLPIQWSRLPLENQLAIDTWIYFWTFISVSLMYISVFMPCCPGGTERKVCLLAWDWGSVSGLGRYPEEINGNPLQYSCLENSMSRRAWLAVGVCKESDTTERLILSLSRYMFSLPWLNLFISVLFCVMVLCMKLFS